MKTYVYTKQLHTGIFTSFIHKGQNLETTKMSFSKGLDN